jgi:hypothetical protein
MARHPGERYYVISGDGDFEPVISHLTGNHHHVSRHAEIALLPFLRKRKPAPPRKVTAPTKARAAAKKPVQDRRTKVISRLKNPANRSRPTDESALRAYLKTALGKTSTDDRIDEVVQSLLGDGTLAIAANEKVTYLPNGG